MGTAVREGEVGASCESVADETGRGLLTWAADKMNFGSASEGACGTTIFRKQVGHSSCPPLVLESAVMCWPQTGHANLNSLIGFGRRFHSRPRRTTLFLSLSLAPNPPHMLDARFRLLHAQRRTEFKHLDVVRLH